MADIKKLNKPAPKVTAEELESELEAEVAPEPVKATVKAAAPKAESRGESTRDIIRAVMEEVMPAMIAAQRSAGPMQTTPVESAPNRRLPTENCSECGQYKVACGSKHVKMVVYPTNLPEFGEWFRGAFINGKCYLSNDSSHAITVPADAQGDILAMVRGWEVNERESRMGRKKERNSGDASMPRRIGETASPQDAWR